MLSKTASKERDMKVVEFINIFPCYSDTIQKIFYTKRCMANKHLTILYNDGYINRERKFSHDKYFYYTGKPRSRKEHYDIIAKAYHWITKNDYEILNVKVQNRQNSIEPDMIVEIKQNNQVGTLAVEVERANKNIERTINKYENTNFNSVLLISHLPTDYIKTDCVKVLYNLNFKELD